MQLKNGNLYNEKQIISQRYGTINIIIDSENNIWFGLSDISRALKIDFPAEFPAVLQGPTILVPRHEIKELNNRFFVSFAGVYICAYTKNGREAIEFLRWLNIEALPSIKASEKPQITLNDLAIQLDTIATCLAKLSEAIVPVIQIAAEAVTEKKNDSFRPQTYHKVGM